MADRTVRAIFEARVSGAQKGMRDLATDVDKAGKEIDGLTRDLRTLDKQDTKPTIDVAIEAAEKDVQAFRDDLDRLQKLETSPQVDADVATAQRKLDDAESRLKALRGAKAEMVVTADVGPAERELDSLGDEGSQAGEDAGEGLSKGIIAALATIPIAGAIVGIGAAIGTALFKGVQDGLAIEAREDLFSVRTGLDAETARKFGRAAGEAYADAWGESIGDNLETARVALQQGLIDGDAEQAEIEKIISSLAGLGDLMGQDIPRIAAAAGTLVRSGFSANVESAMDTLVVGFQNGVDKGEDMLDTLIEYPSVLQKLGLTADEAMGLLNQGLVAGARNSDFVADALKEFQIRATDNSKLSAQGFELIGLAAEEMTRKIAAGGVGAKEGLDQVLDGLRAMTDPVERNTAGVALFGTKWEDLGDTLLALDVTTAVDSLGGVAAVAGAAERALTAMSDNTASQIESAKRNIEVAADGIKGALAAAFSDEISGAAEWVQRNRGPVMQFLADIVVGIFDFASAAVESTATAHESFARFAASAGIPILNFVNDVAQAMGRIGLISDDTAQDIDDMTADGILSLQRLNTEAPAVADNMRDTFGGAIDRMRTKFEDWAGPEILKAQVHDAVLAATERLADLSTAIDSTEGTITINGESVNAEEALAIMVDSIDESTGTVTIDGNEVPADRALDALIRAINQSKGDVTVGANTAAAESAIAYLTRPRVIHADVRVSGSSLSAIPTHDGGWTGRLPGRNAGGFVPGLDPGYDNVLWPLYTGGTVLDQPLAGGEFVVNSTDARFWGPLLEWMNAGGRPPAAQQDGGGFPSHITLVDESGGILTRARVVAGEVIAGEMAGVSRVKRARGVA